MGLPIGYVPGGTASLADIVTGLGKQRGEAEAAALDPQAKQAQIANVQAATRGQQIANTGGERDLADQAVLKNVFSRIDTTAPFAAQQQSIRQNAAKYGISAPGYFALDKQLTEHSKAAAELSLKQNEDKRAQETYSHGRIGDILQSVQAAGAENSPERMAALAQATPELNGLAPGVQFDGSDNGLKYHMGVVGHTKALLDQANVQAGIAAKNAELQTSQAALPGVQAKSLEAQTTADQMQRYGMSEKDLAAKKAKERELQQKDIELSQTGERNKATAAYQQGELGVRQGDLGVKQTELSKKYGDSINGLSDTQRKLAQQLAEGNLNPTALSRLPDKEAIMNGALGLNPEYQRAYETKESFTNPEKTQAKNLGTISRIVGHIGRFESNSKQMGTDPVYGLGGTFTGLQKATAADGHAIAGELEKLVSGGVGSVEQIREWQKGLRSPVQSVRQKSIDEVSQLIGSQYEGMHQTYKAGTGKDLPLEKYVTPAGQEFLKSKGINVRGAASAAPSGGASGVQVKDPRGVVHTFPNEAAAANFRKAAGL